MNYVENVFICLAAPIILAILCMRKKSQRMMIFMLVGMAMCLFSSYVSTFIAYKEGADALKASTEISPLVEEIMKIMPVLFYVLVFEVKANDIADALIITALGFATFENVCFLLSNDSLNPSFLLIRGFGTGAMHVVCGYIVAVGILFLWNKNWLRVAGSVALLSAAISFHGIYNLLVSQEGAVRMVGFFIPLVCAILATIIKKRLLLAPRDGVSGLF